MLKKEWFQIIKRIGMVVFFCVLFCTWCTLFFFEVSELFIATLIVLYIIMMYKNGHKLWYNANRTVRLKVFAIIASILLYVLLVGVSDFMGTQFLYLGTDKKLVYLYFLFLPEIIIDLTSFLIFITRDKFQMFD